MSNKKLLILERSKSNLSMTKDADGSVVLEGVFTEIGVKNKNNRIYEEAEVLPHINELKEKVKTNKLLGELDHPKDFDISLSNVSHVIEDLDYDLDHIEKKLKEKDDILMYQKNVMKNKDRMISDLNEWREESEEKCSKLEQKLEEEMKEKSEIYFQFPPAAFARKFYTINHKKIKLYMSTTVAITTKFFTKYAIFFVLYSF